MMNKAFLLDHRPQGGLDAPPWTIAIVRARLALTYHEYTLEILERGLYLN